MQYIKCLELSYTHNYFADPAANLFSFVPLSQSQQRLKELQLQFTATNSGGFIAAPVKYNADGQRVYATPVDENTRVSFAVYSTASYFSNFTQMPDIEPGEQVFYLCAEASDGGELCFENRQVYPLEQKGLLVNDSKFCVTSRTLDLSVTSEVGGQGNPLFPDPSLYYLDISQWPDALYIVSKEQGDTPVDDFFGEKVFVCRELIANPPLLLLDCLLPASAKSGRRINLLFSSRAVYWQYQIKLTNKDAQLDGLEIDSASAHFTGLPDSEPARPEFEPVQPELEQGKKFLAPEQNKAATSKVFVSNGKSALTQAPWLGISLKSATGEVIVENLPNPNIELIYRIEGKGKITAGEYYASIKVEI